MRAPHPRRHGAGAARRRGDRVLIAPARRAGADSSNPRSLRTLTQFHEHPALVTWWAARVGKIVAWLDPARRRHLLSAVSLVAICVAVPRKKVLGATAGLVPGLLVAALLVALAYGCYLAAVHYGRLPRVVRRRPQVWLHAGAWTLIAIRWFVPASRETLRQALLVLVALIPMLVWRLGYLLKTGQRGKARGTGFRDHFFYLWPLWGGTATPYGKGFEYLTAHEATRPEAIARAQLAGVRLLLLAALWSVTADVFAALVYGDGPFIAAFRGWSLHVPHLAAAIAGPHRALVLAWASVYGQLIDSTLEIAVKGHVIVGVLRLFGFYAFRNTYRPLLAESVVEFWNRYYYYFKELLVEFFFYPTYARWRVRAWLRTLLAIFAAAFAGNLYYHVLISHTMLVDGDVAAVWRGFRSRTFYSLLLASGIFVSMQREQRRRGARAAARSYAWPARLRRIAGVWTFFALIHIWGIEREHPTFTERVVFFLSLFGG